MSDILLFGTRKGLLTFRGGGLARIDFPGQPVSYSFRDPHGVTWAAIEHGHWGTKLHRSTDGETWEEVPAPAYPEGALLKKGKPAKLEYIWCMASGRRGLYLGTNPGALFVDGGQGARLVEGLWNHPSRLEHWDGGGRDTPGIHSIWEDPRDSDHIFVAVSTAGVFETRDGGETWVPRNKGLRADFLPNPGAEVGQDPHCLAVCDARPEVMWQQNHCGVYRTTDGAESWQEVSAGPVYFGFPIVAHPTDPDVAWVVPGQSDEIRSAYGNALMVCRTTDGGVSWEEQRVGLPLHAAFDVVYRHAMDRVGTTLVFASTTGNAYISTDDGARWEVLGHNLPPVYSVRFG